MIEPFSGLSKLQISKLYELLGVHIYKYNKNEQILPTIRKENIVGIILQGSAHIINMEYSGDEIIVENLVKNSVFGSNISSTNVQDCQIIATEDTEVVVIDYIKLMNVDNSKHVYFNIFLMNLFDIINSKIKEKNERMRVLEKKQIRERLLEYFDIQYRKRYTKNINLPFTFRDLADYLAVNRSAMFRELKHLKDDKLIEMKDKRIILLYK